MRVRSLVAVPSFLMIMVVGGLSQTLQGPSLGAASRDNQLTASITPSNVAGQCVNTSPRQSASGAAWNGWGASLSNDRFQRSGAGLTSNQASSLKLKWAFSFGDVPWAVSQPVVAGGRIFVGSASGLVYAIDLHTGCTYWKFKAEGPVRAAVTIGPSSSKDTTPSAFFSDAMGNAYRLDANTGSLAWKLRVDDHKAVRTVGSPQLYEGRLYVPVSSFEEVFAGNAKYECCTFRGSIVAIDATTGSIVWRAYSISVAAQATGRNGVGTQLYGPSGAATFSSPTIDTRLNRLYFTTGNSYSEPAADTSDAVLAVDLKSGQILWATQVTPGDAFNVACTQPDKTNCPTNKGDDLDFASPAILVTTRQNKRLLIVGQKSGMIYALNPDESGRKVWGTRIATGGLLGGIMWGSAADSDAVYVAVSDAFTEGKVNPDAGGLVALRVTDGTQLWRTPSPSCGDRLPCLAAQTAAVTLIPGVVFSGSREGVLRAYSSKDGRVLWETGTAREFDTVNGLKAKGGTLDVSGATVVDGIVLTGSGYPLFGGISGNVLLAFSPNGM